MRTRLELVPALLLACLFAACGSDPGTTTANDDSSGTSSTTGTTGTSTDTPTSEPSTDPSGATSTGNTSTSITSTTGDPTGPESTSTADPTDTTSTGEDTTGAISASDTSTSDTSTSDTSTSDASDTSTGDTGDTSTGDPEGLGPAAQDALAALELAVDGVYFLSESDYPWTPFAIADLAPVTQANVKAVIADVYVFHGDPSLADRATEPRTFNNFMDPLTVMQDWWGPEEVERAAQYQAIRDVFEGQLINLQVFRFGQKFGNVLMGQVDIFVLGETADGDVVGMFTISVET